MVKVKFYDQVEDELLEFAVIIAKTNGKWVFCKHKERDTYEVPGGHRERGETILETAKRELWEETGAIDFSIEPVIYGIYFQIYGYCEMYDTSITILKECYINNHLEVFCAG